MAGAMIACKAACLALAALAGSSIPRVADRVLRERYRSMEGRWDEGFAAFAANPGDAACRNWAKRQAVAAASGKLARHHVCRLKEAGVLGKDVDEDSFRGKEAFGAPYRMPDNARRRLACAACAAALFAPGALGCEHALALAAALATAWLLALLCACDMQAKLVPARHTLACLAAASAYALASGGWERLASGALTGALALFAFAAVSLAMERVTGRVAIGMGDLRLLPAIGMAAGPQGWAPGLAGCMAVSLCMACAVLLKGGTRHDYVPYVPALAAWAAIGMAFSGTTASPF